jgi:hypothetical protein
MAAQKEERKQYLVRLLSLSALASGGLLLWLILLSAATATSPSATAGVLRASTFLDTSTPTLTPTVETTPTDAPTATAVATATAPSIPTATSVGNGGNGGNGAAGGTTNGPTTGPQQTEVALSQPTVEGGSSPLGGISSSTFGANGLLIATTLGCVVAVLGIAVGAIAFYALVQNGYGPFLRALALGTNGRKRRKSGTDDAGRGKARGATGDVRTRRSGSGWNTTDDRRARSSVSRRDRDGW